MKSISFATVVSDELDILKSVAVRLETAGLPYMVTGSMAINFYATPRMTRDIDLVVELGETDIGRIVAIFQDDYYIDRDMVEQAVKTRSCSTGSIMRRWSRSIAWSERTVCIAKRNFPDAVA